jgi:hypothetical protein
MDWRLLRLIAAIPATLDRKAFGDSLKNWENRGATRPGRGRGICDFTPDASAVQGFS